MAPPRSPDRHLTVARNAAQRLLAARIGQRRQGNQDHRNELLNTLEATLAAVGGVDRAADSIAVDIGDVRLLIGARCCRMGPFDVTLSS